MHTLQVKEERYSLTLENENEKIFGILHLPKSENLLTSPPLVIVLHGYASSKLGGNLCYVQLAQALVEAGIACFRFDFRGCGDSEGKLASMLIEDFISDTLCVANYLEKQGFSRLGFFGSSFGGSVAILTSTFIDVKALALWSPVASGALWIKDWMEKLPPGTTDVESYQGVKLSQEFKHQFFNLRADKALEQIKETPLLHMQAEHDPIVSLKHQIAFEKCRLNSQAPTRFTLYPESEHQIGRTKVFPQALKEAVQWFKIHL